MEVNPLYVLDINTSLEALITGNWQRAMKHAGAWSSVMKRRAGKGKIEILTWLLDTGGIYPQGNGGKMRFDDMTATQTEIVVSNFGGGLRLTSNEIKDNQLEKNPKVGAMDYAQKWARDRGAESALFPRKNLFKLIKDGLVSTTYDGQPFFSASHPVDPAKPSGSTFSNIITSVPIDQAVGDTTDVIKAGESLGTVFGTIGGLTFNAAGTPRFLVPRVLMVPTTLGYRARQLVGMAGKPGAAVLSQTTNILSDYELEVLEAPELNSLTNGTVDYYVGCEDILSDELGAFIMSEVEPFEMQGYPDVSSAKSNRSQIWEWDLIGRYGFQYGHPYLFFKCTKA